MAKLQVYSLISNLKTTFRRIELIVHIAISVLPGTHCQQSQVKHLVKCLDQNHNIETMSQDCEERNIKTYFSENSATSGARNCTAGSDIALDQR